MDIVACTKGAWLRMNNQAGGIYLAPMVAASDLPQPRSNKVCQSVR